MDVDDDNVAEIFEDSLTTIFGDVSVSHGAPGSTFTYDVPNKGYPAAESDVPLTR
jgi:hypothetical protein